MKVAMISPYALERPGGVQGQVLGLSDELRRRGHEVTVLAPRGRGEPAAGVVRVGRAIAVPANGSVAPVAPGPLAARRARLAVARGGVEVAHLHEPFVPSIGFGLLARHPTPTVATFHRAGLGPGYRLLGPVARRLARGLDAACAVSEAAGATAQAVAGVPTLTLFNGVDLTRFPEPAAVRERGPVRILFLGRHEPRKGLLVLLEAFEQVRAPRDGLELWIASVGPLTGELKRRYPATRSRHWLGQLSDEEVAARLVAADVLCAPSLSGESFGLVVLEALAARTAVVASDLPGYRFAAGGHALLVPPGDPRSLAAALEQAVVGAASSTGASDPAALDAARRHAEGWSLGRLAERYLEVYATVIEATGRGEWPGVRGVGR